jgi:hypothetical protein
VGRGLQRGEDHVWWYPTNVQFKVIQNCHSDYPLYNEYIPIKMGKRSLKKDQKKNQVCNDS